MSKLVHMICAKCGSDEIKFEIDKPDEESCGVDISCRNCGELTSVEEWNEWNKQENTE